MLKSIAFIGLAILGANAQSTTASSSGSTAGLPSCATQCLSSGISSSGCSNTDIACICESKTFIEKLTPCVESSCSAEDLETVIAYATKLCASASVSLDVGAIESAALANATAITTTNSTVATTTGVSNATSTGTVKTSVVTSTGSASASASTAAASSTASSDAGILLKVGSGAAGAGVIAAIAYLL